MLLSTLTRKFNGFLGEPIRNLYINNLEIIAKSDKESGMKTQSEWKNQITSF